MPQSNNSGLPPIPDGYELEGPWKQYQNLPPIPDGYQLKFDDLPTPSDGYQLKFDDLPTPSQPQQQPAVTGMRATAPSDPIGETGGILKAFGSGVAKGITSLPGDIVSLVNLVRRGYGAIRGNGYDPKKDDYSLGQGYDAFRADPDAIYKPQNNEEAWAKTAGEYAPALVTGPESLAGKGALDVAKVLAKRAVTQAAVPALAANSAGKLAEGTPFEPYAPVVAGFLAGVRGTRPKAPEPITSADIGAVTNKNFDAFRSAPVTIKPDVVEGAAKGIRNDLTASGLSKAPANDMVAQYIGNANPVSLNQLQETRSLLSKAAARSDTPEGVAAIRAKQAVDSLMAKLTPTDTVVGAANALPQALADLKQGRTNAAVQNQLESLENATYRGQMTAGASGGDPATALRQQVKSLLLNRQAMSRLSQYKPDMEKIAEGTLPLNALRKVAQLTGGTGGWHSGPWWLGALLAEPLSGTVATAAAGMPFVGMGLKKIEAARTLAKVNALRDKIAGNAQGLPSRPVPNNPLLTRALITSLAIDPSAQQ